MGETTMDKLSRAHLEGLALELTERQFEQVPVLRGFCDGTWTDRDYYTRFMIETVLQIRLDNIADAYALYKASFGDYRLAAKLAKYLADEIGHEGMFVRDLAALGVTLDEINATEPFPGTARTMAYLRLATDQRGPAPVALWDWYLEWWSDRYAPALVGRAAKEFGPQCARGAQAHIDLDGSHGHDDMMFETTAQAVELYGSPRSAYADLKIFIDYNSEQFVELYDATVGARAAT
ncbi:iron-containing redox enzyme family protein [Spirillospora sp. CA-294931]|uniref:iron-containing redox enzyme family protein n=1 Tax=Spirillospora sp. CA-294931 TaxID=3240042 RepID=UPI003D93A088